MELYQLRYFEKVAQLESISKAAEALHVSQPALSKALTKLEAELGTKLFNRSGNKISLNQRGVFYLKNVDRMLTELDAISASLQKFDEPDDNSLRVGVYGAQKEALICTSAFLAQNPSVKVAFDVKHSAGPRFNDWSYDVIYYSSSSAFDHISGIPYATRSVCLAVRDDHPLADDANASLYDFKDESFIFLNNTHETLEQCFSICSSHGFYPKVRHITNNKLALLEFVAQGFGVGFIDNPVETSTKHVKLLDLQLESATRQQFFTCADIDKLNVCGRIYLDFVFDYFGIVQDEHSRAALHNM